MVRTSKVITKQVVDIQTVYECIVKSKGNGVSNDDIAIELGIKYTSARRWALILMDHSKVQNRKFPDGKFRYMVGKKPNAPVVSHYRKGELPIPIPALIQALEATPPNNQLQVVLTKKMGLNLVTLAHIAATWSEGESVVVPPATISKLRDAMETARSRALWQAQVYKEVLENKALWNSIAAPTNWFSDEFTPDDARELFMSIKDQME